MNAKSVKEDASDPAWFEIIESFPNWDYKIEGNLQLFYKLKPDCGAPSIEFSVKIIGRLEIAAYRGKHILDLAAIENKIGSILKPVSPSRIKTLIAFLDSQNQAPERLNYVLQNFDSNLIRKYPRSSALCRFCFCKEEGQSLEPITLDFMRTFKTLTTVDLSLDSELPSKGCNSCIASINEAFTIREVAAKSERKLLKFHRETRTKVKFEEAENESMDDDDHDNEQPDEIEMEIEALEEVNVQENKNPISCCKIEIFDALDPTSSTYSETEDFKPDEQSDFKRPFSAVESTKFTEEDGYK